MGDTGPAAAATRRHRFIVMSLLDISHYAARRSLLTLEDRGLVEPVEAPSPGAGRNRQWYAATDLIATWAA